MKYHEWRTEREKGCAGREGRLRNKLLAEPKLRSFMKQGWQYMILSEEGTESGSGTISRLKHGVTELLSLKDSWGSQSGRIRC